MAVTLNAALRLVVEHANDTGESPEKTLDTKALDRAGLVLSGYDSITPGKRLKLAPTDDDVEVTFTAAIGIVIVSRDYSFKLRHAVGETLLGNLRAYVVWAADIDTEIATTSVLLTGNGADTSNLEIWIIEKP